MQERPTANIAKALVAGVKTSQFKQEILHVVDMAGGWHTIEIADKARATLKKRPTASMDRKLVNGNEPGGMAIHPRQRLTRCAGAVINQVTYAVATPI